MSMKGTYQILDEQGFDVESLHPGEIGLELTDKFLDRDNKGEPIIELAGVIFWAADDENVQYIGKEIKWVIFFGKKNDQTPRILKDIFKRAGFETNTWNPDDFPLSEALPGAIKLLAWKKVPMLFKVAQTTRDGSTRNFLNPVKILRADPSTGKEYPDALPEPVSNDLIEEAISVRLEGEGVDKMV